MRDYLVMRLYAPLASWGEIAVGEVRHSAAYPSKSALLGLLGAALGVRRDDDEAQARLNTGYAFGVKLCSAGFPLRDYHTVQAPQSKAKERYYTRRDEVERGELNTLLTEREYRCDALAVVAVAAIGGDAWPLPKLAEKIKAPGFPLYLGRKSCPLAMPLNPQVNTFASLKDALDSLDKVALPGTVSVKQMAYLLRIDQSPRYYWDEDLHADAGMPTSMTLARNDQPLHRGRWQFAPRREHLCLGEGGAS
jgi:CRISPR system Cascade subunit CasD